MPFLRVRVNSEGKSYHRVLIGGTRLKGSDHSNHSCESLGMTLHESSHPFTDAVMNCGVETVGVELRSSRLGIRHDLLMKGLWRILQTDGEGPLPCDAKWQSSGSALWGGW